MSDVVEYKPLSPMPKERKDGATWIQVVELFRRHGMPEPPVRLRDEIVHFMMWGWYGEKAADEIERLRSELSTAYKRGREDMREGAAKVAGTYAIPEYETAKLSDVYEVRDGIFDAIRKLEA